MHTLKKFATAHSAAKLLSIFLAAVRAAQHSLYTSNFLPMPMSKVVEKAIMYKGLGKKCGQEHGSLKCSKHWPVGTIVIPCVYVQRRIKQLLWFVNHFVTLSCEI